jgi:ribosomal protein S18 acetylase RimI-like enzyme
MNAMSIGLLPTDEIQSLRPLAELVWTTTYQHIISKEQISYMLDRFYATERLIELVAAGNPLFGAWVGSDLVGYAHLFMEGHQSQLDKLYVSPLFQRIGVGRGLFEAVKQTALQADCSLMTLRVNRNNTSAIEVYQRLGFGIIATHKKDIGGGFVMDDYLMLMDLIPSEAD